MWKDRIFSQGGKFIFDEYEKKHQFTNGTRIKLINILCNILLENAGENKIFEEAKRNAAESIINLFPNLRDECGETGYVC